MSKRKKHNPIKRAQRLMANVRLWSWESDVDKGIRVLNAEFKRGIVWLPMTGRDAILTANRINNWSLVVRVITWYPDGKVDVKTVIADFRNVDLARLEIEAKALRKEALDKVQKGHIVDVGWLAISFTNTPRTEGNKDLVHMGAISEARQMLWNQAITEELNSLQIEKPDD